MAVRLRSSEEEEKEEEEWGNDWIYPRKQLIGVRTWDVRECKRSVPRYLSSSKIEGWHAVDCNNCNLPSMLIQFSPRKPADFMDSDAAYKLVHLQATSCLYTRHETAQIMAMGGANVVFA
eukprot:898480-Pelagomonas_calceolata.AAC.1